jgi:hypothetical protein
MMMEKNVMKLNAPLTGNQILGVIKPVTTCIVTLMMATVQKLMIKEIMFFTKMKLEL